MGETERLGYAERILRNARERFVGRRAIRSELLHALRAADDDHPSVVVLVGPPGVGKSALASLMRLEAEAEGRTVAWIAGERVEPNRAELEEALGDVDTSFARLGRGARADLLVVDAFEQLEALGPWLFTRALHRAGPRLLTLVTSRRPMDAALRADVSLAPILQERALEPLAEAESVELLARLGTPEERRRGVAGRTRGLPLALTLAAAHPVDDRDPWAPDVVAPLVRSFLREVKSEPERDALRALAQARVIDEPLLEAMTGQPGAPLYDFLRRLGFVSETPEGLTPHALVREVIHADHLRRDRPGSRQMAERGVRALLGRTRADDAIRGLRRLLFDGLHILRTEGAVSGLPLERARSTHLEPVEDHNLDETVAEVIAHEGEAGGQFFRDVYAAGDRNVCIVRSGSDGAFVGLVGDILPDQLDRSLAGPDPRTAHALASVPPHVRSEGFALFRWFFAKGGGELQSPAMQAIIFSGPSISFARAEPSPWVVMSVGPPEQWLPLARPFSLEPIGSVVEEGGKRYGAFLRLLDPSGLGGGKAQQMARGVATLLRMLGDFEEGTRSENLVPTVVDEEALRDALAHLHEPHALAGSPLCELVADGAADPGLALGRWIESGIEALAEHRGYRDHAELLRVTYVEGAVKQRAAAADLGIPYGTYRYRRRKAIALLAQELRSAVPRQS